MLATTSCGIPNGLIGGLNVVSTVVEGLALAEPLMCGPVIPLPVCPLVETGLNAASMALKAITAEISTNDTNGNKIASVSGAIAKFASSVDPVAKPFLTVVIQAFQAFQNQMSPVQLAKAYGVTKLTLERSNEIANMRMQPNAYQRYQLHRINARADATMKKIAGGK